MPRYGSNWDERRQQSSDYHPDQGRWRDQQDMRGQDESWRENRGEQFGQGRDDWRQRSGQSDWRGSENDERRFGGSQGQFWGNERERGSFGGGFGSGRFSEHGSSGYGSSGQHGQGSYGQGNFGQGYGQSSYGQGNFGQSGYGQSGFGQGGYESGMYGSQSSFGRNQDFERGGRWGSDRGMYDRDERGPFQRLGDKFREMTGRPGRGPKGYKRSDDRVSDDVCERIARSGVESENVEVMVKGGEVTLSGTVRSRHEKWRLEELVEDVFGVQDVHNNLRVERESQQQGLRTGQPGSENKPSVRH